MFQILRDHLIRDVATAPRPVADRPEVPPPLPSAQLRKLILQPPRCPPLQPLDDLADGFRWRVLDQHVDVIFADDALENADVLGVADLHDQIPATLLDLPLQDGVTVFRHPDQVDGQARDGVAAVTVVAHA